MIEMMQRHVEWVGNQSWKTLGKFLLLEFVLFLFLLLIMPWLFWPLLIILWLYFAFGMYAIYQKYK